MNTTCSSLCSLPSYPLVSNHPAMALHVSCTKQDGGFPTTAPPPSRADMEYTTLGRTSLRVSKIGVGTLQWGDPGSGFGQSYTEADLSSAYHQLVDGGINFFDTAEVYGYQSIKSGSSAEQILGKFTTLHSVGQSDAADDDNVSPVIATKFFTIPWTNFLVGGGFRLSRKSLLAALRESLRRLGRERVDLYQIHFPFPTFSNAALMESLKEAVDTNLTTAVGVSNYSRQQMEEADDILSIYGIPLASNQVQYNLLHRNPESDGILKACKERGITLIAYSPLASGLLTWRTLSRNDTKSRKVQPLLNLLQDIGDKKGGRSISQVALNYLICKGAIPIPGCKTVDHAKSHIGVLGWSLNSEEVKALEEKCALLDL